MNDSVDVLVIGAGPAGTIAASIVNKAGLKVKIVEREKFPRFVIGESLLPRCMEALEEADLLEVVKAKNFQKKFGAKFLRDGISTDFDFAEQFTNGWGWTWQVTRADFDLLLAEEAQRKGVVVDFETTVTGIEFFDDEHSITTVQSKDGSIRKIEARFVIDASGYGRVIPRLFKLEQPSTLIPRKAVFAHLQDLHRERFNEPNRIIIMSYVPGTWAWIIPFSTGVTSLGIVGDYPFFDNIKGDTTQQFKALVENNAYLKSRFTDVPLVFEARKLEAWSATTEQFFGKGYVLVGNATEFLDPIFSSGVMFASVSSQLASNLVIRKLKGEAVDWDTDYTKPMQQGVDVFRSYVMAWYDGTLEKIIYSKEHDLHIRKQICSVLAGYVWDQNNIFVKDHRTTLKQLARLITAQEKLTAMKNEQ
jgi:flavin-dependent dehydrogenase